MRFTKFCILSILLPSLLSLLSPTLAQSFSPFSILDNFLNSPNIRNGFLNTKQSRRPRFLHPSIRPPDPNLRAPDFSLRPPLPNLQPTVFNGGSGSGRPEFQDQIGSFDFQKPVFIKTFPKPVFRDASTESVFNRKPIEPLVFTTISPSSVAENSFSNQGFKASQRIPASVSFKDQQSFSSVPVKQFSSNIIRSSTTKSFLPESFVEVFNDKTPSNEIGTDQTKPIFFSQTFNKISQPTQPRRTTPSPPTATPPSTTTSTSRSAPSSSSYQKNNEGGVSGPNPGSAGSLGGGSTRYYEDTRFYDELLAPHTSQLSVPPYNPYYSPEVFSYTQEVSESDLEVSENITEFKTETDLGNISGDYPEINEEYFEIVTKTSKPFNTTADVTSIIPRGSTREGVQIILSEKEDDRVKQKVEKDDIILITERGTDPIFSELIGSAVSSNNLKRNNQEFKQKSKDFDETFCGGASDLGFCALTPSKHIDDQLEIANQIINQPDTQDFNLDHLMKKCQHVTDVFAGYFLPNLEDLGDTSEFVHSPEETGAPWSWKSYQYKKKQICSSQLSFILPAYAKEVQGTWYRIVQTDEVRQKVALDICTAPGLPCPGISDCGNKSVCTQRYTYQFLLSVQNSLTDCPKIRAFKFPTGCVCHMEF